MPTVEDIADTLLTQADAEPRGPAGVPMHVERAAIAMILDLIDTQGRAADVEIIDAIELVVAATRLAGAQQTAEMRRMFG